MLIMGQRILLLDEPTFGQDQRNAQALLEHLRTLHNQGHTILVITHDMALVAEYAQHVAVLNNGQLLYHGPTAQLFAQPRLLRQAHLTPPPLAQLSQQLATECHPVWQGLSTLNQFLSVAASQMEVTAS
jgi:energy-coupling factor transport system ATP-binding protein